MLEVQLFLGFPVDKIFSQELEKINPVIAKQFIQRGENYLQEITHDGMPFLGKYAGKMATPLQLELLEANIYSLLRKIVPDFSYQEVPLYLFSIEETLSRSPA